MPSGKHGSYKVSKSSQSTGLSSTTKKVLITIALLVVVAVIITLVVLLVNKKNTGKPHPGPAPGPTPAPTPAPTPGPQPKHKITGLWTNNASCGLPVGGSSSFNLIALSSALPQDYNASTDLSTFFSSKIVATYGDTLKSASADYIISIGGSNATLEGWLGLLSAVSTSAGVSQFYKACTCRGLRGIDLDIELADESKPAASITQWLNGLVKLMKDLKAIDSKFIMQVTVLLGRPTWLAVLCADPSIFDYLGIMLYNGGMYSADKPNGAGCSWDGWAELVLSGGKAGCTKPLGLTSAAYIAQTGINKVPANKVICGLITDTDPTTNIRMDAAINTRMNSLVAQYGGAGVMIWLLPGWTDFSKSGQPDNNTLLTSLGYKYDTTKCMVGCPNTNKCVSGKGCVASNCGKVVQAGVTDAACAPCGTGQTWWPCNVPGLCVVSGSEPPQPKC
jgi:hypothetical protein